MKPTFLPVTREEAQNRGWDPVDFVLVSGDAYVDHPSFGPAVIGRWLEAHGFSVGVIPQPDWTDSESFNVFGIPRLAFLVTAGNMDSMVNHYTVNKKRRREDAYSPGGAANRRPDRAATVYARKLKKQYAGTPVILGGIEASLRRMAHYDYWEDRMKPSILMDTKADLLVYGMGERAVIEIAEGLKSGIPVSDLTYIRGTAFFTRDLTLIDNPHVLPAWQTLQESRKQVARSFMKQMENTDPFSGQALAEPYTSGFIVQLPPAEPLSTEEMDQVYRLPYMRQAHPMYRSTGGVPAHDEVRFSLVSNRGCFGACHFCAITFHQGKLVQSRSHDAIVEEAELMTEDPAFKGYIHDVGGPTANFRLPACEKMAGSGACTHRECMTPVPCPRLKVSHSDYVALLQRLRKLPKVKKVFIRSGVRFDYVMADPDPLFFEELCRHHISGQLKVAPEHADNTVLELMGKPSVEVFDAFRERYETFNAREDRKQYLVPYLIASHPGSDLKAAIELALYLKKLGHTPEQVQDFYPTPGTLSTVMYYTELDPRTENPVYVPKDPMEKKMQRALMHYRLPENHALVRQALNTAGRRDLIGRHPDALVPPGEEVASRDPKPKTHPPKGKPANRHPQNAGGQKKKSASSPSAKPGKIVNQKTRRKYG